MTVPLAVVDDVVDRTSGVVLLGAVAQDESSAIAEAQANITDRLLMTCSLSRRLQWPSWTAEF